MLNARRILQNKLITDLTALTKASPSTGKVFEIVSKFFYDIPASKPALWLRNAETRNDQENISFNETVISFDAVVLEAMQAGKNQAEYNTKVDRLTACEWYLYEYLQKIPNNLGNVSGVTVYEVRLGLSRYSEATLADGIGLILTVPFDLKVNIDVKLIN